MVHEKPEASSIIFTVKKRINQLKEGISAEQRSLRANDDSVRYARVEGVGALVPVNSSVIKEGCGPKMLPQAQSALTK